MSELENILTEGCARMELCLREVELVIALYKTKKALSKNNYEELLKVKVRYDEIIIMTLEEAVEAWTQRVKELKSQRVKS